MIHSAHPKPRSLADNPSPLRGHAASTSSTGIDELTSDSNDPFDLELVQRIITRIESRLPGRVRQLTVYMTDNAVVLAGQCSTFYTKQLAQHVAMGVLEYERLINNIDVRVAK